MGNPGSEKNILANCVAGRPLFKSGLTFGSGTTYRLDKGKHGGIMYLDILGLADIYMRRPAASAITEALRQNGKYEIFFVVTMCEGRLGPEDLEKKWIVPINDPDINCLKIIMKKLSRPAFNLLQGNNLISEELALFKLLDVDNYKVLLLQTNYKLLDAENEIADFPELVRFVEEEAL